MVWLSISIALLTTLLSDWIVNLLYGKAYYESSVVLVIHIWAGVFVSLGVSSSGWLLSENLTRISFWRAFYGMIFNVFLNYILIPKIGAKGAALSTLISYFVAAFFFDFFNRKTKPIFYMKLNTLNFRRTLFL